jgi:hypothetical protein
MNWRYLGLPAAFVLSLPCTGHADQLESYLVAQLASPPEQPALPSSTAQPPPASNPGFDLSLSPRVWFTTESLGGGLQNYPSGPGHAPTVASVGSDLSYPMYGLSATISPHSMQTWADPLDFTLTAIGGSGQGSQTIVENSGLVFRNKYEQDRVDFEGLARISLSPTVKFVFGPRFLWEDNSFVFPPNVPVLVHPPGNTVDQPEYAFIGEVGVQLFAPITPTGNHILFAGAVIGPGYGFLSTNQVGVHLDNPFFGFLDVNAGYQYSFNNRISGYIRYRAQIEVQTSGGPLLQNVYIKHGPELALTIKFW